MLAGDIDCKVGHTSRAVIVGNGGSVDSLGEAFWRVCRQAGTLIVGTNRALAMAALQDVRLDAMVIRDRYRSLWHDQRFGEQYHRDLWIPSTCRKVGPAQVRVTHCDEYLRFTGGWQGERQVDRNGEAAVMKNDSVVLMACNWAWLQGARELVLVGVDYCGRHASLIPPYNSADIGLRGQYDEPVGKGIERQFASMRDAVTAGGGSVVNVSSGTRLAALDVEDWREVFQVKREVGWHGDTVGVAMITSRS